MCRYKDRWGLVAGVVGHRHYDDRQLKVYRHAMILHTEAAHKVCRGRQRLGLLTRQQMSRYRA